MKLLTLVIILSACFILIESRRKHKSRKKRRNSHGHRKRFRQQEQATTADVGTLSPEEMYQCNDFPNEPAEEYTIPEFTELEIQCNLGCIRINGVT